MKLLLLSFPDHISVPTQVLVWWSPGNKVKVGGDVWPPHAYLDGQEVDLQLRDSPPNAAPNPEPKGDGPKVVNSIQASLPQPALRPELLGPREVLIRIGCGIVAEGQLGLKTPFAREKEKKSRIT